MYTITSKVINQRKTAENIDRQKVKATGSYLKDNRLRDYPVQRNTIQMQPTTRSQFAQQAAVAASQGLDASNIIEGRRATREPDRFGSPAHTYQDRHGNTHFNPGNSVLASVRMRLSGNSLTDIAHLVATTGRGGPGSNEVWHHMSDYNPVTGEGTVVLMPSAVHAANHHMGGSALARAVMYDDPDRMARYGQHH